MEVSFKNVTLITNPGTTSEKTILNDVSFSFSDNKIYGIVGNSNSGKTSIPELISGLISPTRGSVCIDKFVNDGRLIKNINKLRLLVGYIYKNPYDMFICKTVKKELEFGMKHFKYKLNKIETRTKDALKMVGLNETYLDKDPLKLNFSEVKKLALAITLIYNPKLIILDEPTIGLSNIDKKELIRLLKILKNKYDKTILVLSKDTDFLYSLVDYSYIFYKGSLMSEGNTSVYKDYHLFNLLGLKIPDMVVFTSVCRGKGINLRDYKDISDLVKGVCDNVF